jgi:hypothetical protein
LNLKCQRPFLGLACVVFLCSACTAPGVGRVVGSADGYCQPGDYGRGGIYPLASARCVKGQVVFQGYDYCPDGKGGGSVFETKYSKCLHSIGLVVSLRDEYCQPGPKGTGGIFDPDMYSCSSGMISYIPAGQRNRYPSASGDAKPLPEARDRYQPGLPTTVSTERGGGRPAKGANDGAAMDIPEGSATQTSPSKAPLVRPGSANSVTFTERKRSGPVLIDLGGNK